MEHVLLNGLTAREALAAGERQALIVEARIARGTGPHEALIYEQRAQEILDRQERR